MKAVGFFAYPSGQAAISEAVQSAVDTADQYNFILQPWESLTTVGLKLDNLIREKIRDANFLVADITYQNFNVFYEIGFAIALVSRSYQP